MKWDEIENLINDNRDEFNSEQPDEGHDARFLSKLNQYYKKNSYWNRTAFFKIAASVSILIISSIAIWAYFQFNYKPGLQFNITQSVIEFREAQDYFVNQIEISEEQLKKLSYYEPNHYNKEQLQMDLNSNPNDERLMNAIIDLYIIKLDAINQLIQSFSISEIKEKNNNSYENNI